MAPLSKSSPAVVWGPRGPLAASFSLSTLDFSVCINQPAAGSEVLTRPPRRVSMATGWLWPQGDAEPLEGPEDRGPSSPFVLSGCGSDSAERCGSPRAYDLAVVLAGERGSPPFPPPDPSKGSWHSAEQTFPLAYRSPSVLGSARALPPRPPYPGGGSSFGAGPPPLSRGLGGSLAKARTCLFGRAGSVAMVTGRASFEGGWGGVPGALSPFGSGESRENGSRSLEGKRFRNGESV